MTETAPPVPDQKAETFYPITPSIPAIGVRVVVIWAGRQFAAARAVDKKAHTVRWVEECGGKLVWLNDEPDCWRPEKPDLWKAPLPEPLASTQPRMVDIRPHRNRYSAMSAQAEKSSRVVAEIEAEIGAPDEAPPTADEQWWLTERMTYSPPGAVSVREAEGRIARAILTDGIRGSYGGPQRYRETSSALSQFVHETLLSTDAEHLVERFEPSPRDLSDYQPAFDWFVQLNPPELWHRSRPVWSLNDRQKLLVWRVTGASWRRLASITGGSHTGARLAYGGVLALIERAANGNQVFEHVTVRDRMAALRERNRAFASR